MYKKVVSLTFSRGKDSNTHLIQYKIFIAQSLRFLKVDNDSFQGMLFDSNQYNSLGEDLRTYLFYSKTFLLPSDYSKKFYKLESAFSVDSENYRTLMTYVLPEVCKFEDPLTRDFLNKYLSITTAPKPNVDIPMESDFLAKTNQRFCPMGLGDILNRQMMFFKSKDVYSALAGFQDAIRCIDKAVKGVYSEYLNMRHEEDKQKVQTIIVELIEASDLVTCYLERLIQECYNSLFYGKESQKGIFIFPYRSKDDILGSQKFNNPKFKDYKFSTIFNRELTKFIDQCQDLSFTSLKPYVLKSGLELSLISFACYIKHSYEKVLCEYAMPFNRASLAGDQETIAAIYQETSAKRDEMTKLFFDQMQRVRTHVQLLLDNNHYDPSITDALHGYLVKLCAVGYTGFWAKQAIADMGQEFVAECSAHISDRLVDYYAMSESPEVALNQVFEHVNKSKNYFLQEAFLMGIPPSQFTTSEDGAALSDYFDVIEKMICLYPLMLKGSTFLKFLMKCFCFIEDPSLRDIIKERVDRDLTRHISTITQGMKTRHNSDSETEGRFFHSYIEDTMKYLISEQRHNLLRLLVLELQSIKAGFQAVKNHSTTRFLSDVIDDMGRDYELSNYVVSDGFDFRKELESGRLLELPDEDLPIRLREKNLREMSVDVSSTDSVSIKTDMTSVTSEAHVRDTTSSLSSSILVRLKRSDFDIYRKIIEFRPFASSSHVRIKLSDIQRLFKAFNTPRFKVQDDYSSSQDNEVFGSVASPQGTSHRKLQIGTRFYVDGELVQTLVSTKPITEVDGVVPDYQIKQLKIILLSLPIQVEEIEKESGGKLVSPKDQMKSLRR